MAKSISTLIEKAISDVKAKNWAALEIDSSLENGYSSLLDQQWNLLSQPLGAGAAAILQNKEKYDEYLAKVNSDKIFAVSCACVLLSAFPRSEANDPKSTVIAMLHARAIQVCQEIMTLLISGFVDGAIGRWRTLYELYAVLCAVVRGNNEIAQQYIDYSKFQKIETLKATSKDSVNSDDYDEVMDNLHSRYPKAFFSPLGWLNVNRHSSKQRLSFFSLIKKYGMEPFISYYQLASENIHSSPSSIIYPLGAVDVEGQLAVPAGPAWEGLELPCELTIRTCSHICVELSNYSSESERSGLYNLFLRISEELCERLLYFKKDEISENEISRKP